ncbi:TPA: hypothetical protein ACKOIF_003060 [Clostridioides difficile]
MTTLITACYNTDKDKLDFFGGNKLWLKVWEKVLNGNFLYIMIEKMKNGGLIMHLFPATLFLGLAGFDVAGAIIIITALSMRARKKDIYIFAITSLLTTIIVGILFSKVLGTGVIYLTDIFNYIPDIVYAIIGAVIGFILLYWFIERVFINDKYQKKEEKKETYFSKFIVKGLFFLGILFSLWAVSDPSFWGLITIASQSSNILLITLSFAIWMIVGQLPLYILVIAMMFNKQEKILRLYDDKIKKNKSIEKVKRIFRLTLSIIILITSIYFIADSVFYFITGKWLF